MFILATDFSLALDSGGKGILVFELDFSHLILVSFSLILDHEKKSSPAFICEVFVSFLSCFFTFFMFFRSIFRLQLSPHLLRIVAVRFVEKAPFTKTLSLSFCCSPSPSILAGLRGYASVLDNLETFQ